jgi:hypothetical protein
MPTVAGPLNTTQPWIPLIAAPERCPGISFSVADYTALNALDKQLLSNGQRIHVESDDKTWKFNSVTQDFVEAPAGVSTEDQLKLNAILPPIPDGVLVYASTPDMVGAVPLNGATLAPGTIYVSVSNPDDYVGMKVFSGRMKLQELDATDLTFRLDMNEREPGVKNLRVRAEAMESNIPAIIEATYTVTAPPIVSLLVASNNVINREVSAGLNPSSTEFLVSTSDDADVAISVTDNQTWISATPSTATTPALIALNVNSAALAPGSYSAVITVSATDYEPINITFNLLVSASGAFNVLASNNSSYTGLYDFDDSIVEGTIYVKGDPLGANITQGVWKLDGAPYATRTAAPFPLGGGVNGAFDTKALANGLHTYELKLSSPGRQNLAKQSRNWKSAEWSRFQTDMLTVNPIIAADGSQTMYKCVESAGVSGTHQIQQYNIVRPNPGTKPFVTFSFYCRKPGFSGDPNANGAARPRLYIRAGETGNNPATYIFNRLNLDTLAFTGAAEIDPSGLVSAAAWTASNAPNNTILVKVSANFAASMTSLGFSIFLDDGTTNSYLGVANSGCYLSDLHVCEGTSVNEQTAYVVTTTATVNESSQDVTLTGSFTVDNPASEFKTSTTKLDFAYTVGGSAPAAKNIDLQAIGANIAYEVSVDAPWITTNSSGGANAGTPATHAVSASITGLAVGIYGGNVVLSADGYPSITIPVSLNVQADTATYAIYQSADLTEPFSGAARVANGTIVGSRILYVAATNQGDIPVTLAAGDTLKVWFDPPAAPAGQNQYAFEDTAVPAYTITSGAGAFRIAQGQATNTPTTIGTHKAHFRWFRASSQEIVRETASFNVGTSTTTGGHISPYGFWVRSQGNDRVQSNLTTNEIALLRRTDIQGMIYKLRPRNFVSAGTWPAPGTPLGAGNYNWSTVDNIVNYVCDTLGKKIIFILNDMYHNGPPQPLIDRGYTSLGYGAQQLRWDITVNGINEGLDRRVEWTLALWDRYKTNRNFAGISTEEFYYQLAAVSESLTAAAVESYVTRIMAAGAMKDRMLLIGNDKYTWPSMSNALLQSVMNKGVGWYDCGPRHGEFGTPDKSGSQLVSAGSYGLNPTMIAGDHVGWQATDGTKGSATATPKTVKSYFDRMVHDAASSRAAIFGMLANWTPSDNNNMPYPTYFAEVNAWLDAQTNKTPHTNFINVAKK